MVMMRLQGQGEGTLSDTLAVGPNQGFQTVLSNALVTTQIVGEIPANAKVPAHLSVMVDSGIWFVGLGNAAADVLSSAIAPYRLDPSAGPIGIVIDDPRKGFVLAIKPAAGAGILRAEASWGV